MHTVWLSILCGCLVFNSFISATCINNEGWVLAISLGSPAQKSSVCAHPPWAPLIPTAGPGTLALISGQEVQPVFSPKPCSCNVLFVITFNILLVSSDPSPADVQNLPMGGGACPCPSGCPAAFSSFVLHLPTEDTCFKCTAPFFHDSSIIKWWTYQTPRLHIQCWVLVLFSQVDLYLQSVRPASTSCVTVGEKSGSFPFWLPAVKKEHRFAWNLLIRRCCPQVSTAQQEMEKFFRGC